MATLGRSKLRNSGGENLASESDQPAGRIALLPFSGKFCVDEGLKLSNEKFKEKISYFFKDTNTTPLSQLTAVPPFPTPHVLAQFASKTYTDYNKHETDTQYEKRLALPDGWKLLTTASNDRKINGYFGAAYWHPEHQQVVIAHRGTKNLGALWTDLVGVVFENHAPQMSSASTFAIKVVEVLREIDRIKRVSFQLFFTGHSLGGWLAQLTTFGTEYFKREDNLFLKSYDSDCYHPHTVVFDSPGCKDMLSQMKDTFDVRLDGRSIDLEQLDITSYLSAPNRINTCNAHIGTVYRIFPDLSDMGWWERVTALYNKSTHSMKKIVETFDPKTGQILKDEQGQPKVQVVVDWPINTILKGVNEYKKFFKWATHLNDYHPNIKHEAYQSKRYNPIRYQTKVYKERENSFSIFSEEEQEFLQRYIWLRDWSEFFKPKELFCVMENNQAKEDAEKLLKCFEIEEDTVRCTDASALQALIPYVKRLLQLFPEIKEKTERASSSYEVRKRGYRLETRLNVERINQSPLEFNSDSSNFREFLESEQQIVLNLQMVKGDEWTGLIKVYQVLKKTGRLSEGQYIVLKLDSLLKMNQMMDLSKLMQSTVTPFMLLIACEDNQQLDEETENVIITLFDTIEHKTNIKIIFITGLEGSIVPFLHHSGRRIFGNRFVRRNEQLTWSDLTANSQTKLLENSVKFQGANIYLNQLMSAEFPINKFMSLGDLLQENGLTIADPVPISKGYNESYYVGRTFRIQRAIKQDIFSDKDVTDSRVCLASSEQEYKQLCQLNPNSNVHWLENGKAGKLLWQQSQGTLETVRRYIDTDSSHTYTDDLVKLLEQAEHQRVMLISDTAGTGKSTVLTHISRQLKQAFPAKWVVRIDLNDHTDVLNALKPEQIDKEQAIEFVSEKLLKLKPGLEIELFKQCCEQKQKVRIVIILDAFDEICPFYKETVIGLLQALRQTAVEQLWVSTRSHLRNELEDVLQQLSYTLEPFSEENQVEFLTKFWSLKDWFTEMNSKEKEERKNKLENYGTELLKKLTLSVRDKDRHFTAIPFQCRMLAEAFDEEVTTFCQSSESKPELQFQLDLLELYGRFIDRKYDVYQEEKLQVRVTNAFGRGQREHHLNSIRKDHQLLAFKALFTDKQVALFQNNSTCSYSPEELTRIGIMQVNLEGKLQFIHHTFAEYYVADGLVKSLTEGDTISRQAQTFILRCIFLQGYYRMIRAFIDGLLSRYKPSEKILKQYAPRINDMKNGCLLHRVAQEGNVNIIEFLLRSASAGGHKNTASRLLVGQDTRKRTAWYMAAESGEIDALQKIWDLAKDCLTRKEIKDKLLLATDMYGNTAWHWSVKRGKPDVLQKIWDFAEDILTAEDVKNKLLLAADSYGDTVWHWAANRGKLDVLQKIWDLSKANLTVEEIKHKVLLAADCDGNTAWNRAAKRGTLYDLQKIWDMAKEILTAEEMTNMLLLKTDSDGNTAWHRAAMWGKLDELKKIWNLAKDNLTTEELKIKLLLSTDSKGDTVWHLAGKTYNLDLLKKILDLAKENLTTEEIKNSLLLATDSKGNTAWHLAANRGKLDLLQKILD